MPFNKGNFPSVSQSPRSLSKPLHNFRDYLKGKGKVPLTQRPPGTGAEGGGEREIRRGRNAGLGTQEGRGGAYLFLLN